MSQKRTGKITIQRITTTVVIFTIFLPQQKDRFSWLSGQDGNTLDDSKFSLTSNKNVTYFSSNIWTTPSNMH